jgi:hypothetical protein
MAFVLLVIWALIFVIMVLVFVAVVLFHARPAQRIGVALRGHLCVVARLRPFHVDAHVHFSSSGA